MVWGCKPGCEGMTCFSDNIYLAISSICNCQSVWRGRRFRVVIQGSAQLLICSCFGCKMFIKVYKYLLCVSWSSGTYYYSYIGRCSLFLFLKLLVDSCGASNAENLQQTNRPTDSHALSQLVICSLGMDSK